MGLRITQVDAFTARPFTGNPAAVCILPEPPQEWWMQDVAREMNLSETAFLLPHEEGFDLRWFTPTAEVELCGHATLAAAHVLWEEGHLDPEAEAHFYALLQERLPGTTLVSIAPRPAVAQYPQRARGVREGGRVAGAAKARIGDPGPGVCPGA